jgi:hypothetical protein
MKDSYGRRVVPELLYKKRGPVLLAWTHSGHVPYGCIVESTVDPISQQPIEGSYSGRSTRKKLYASHSPQVDH